MRKHESVKESGDVENDDGEEVEEGEAIACELFPFVSSSCFFLGHLKKWIKTGGSGLLLKG